MFAYAGVAGEAGFNLDAYPNMSAWIERVTQQPGHLAQVHPYSMDPNSVKELG